MAVKGWRARACAVVGARVCAEAGALIGTGFAQRARTRTRAGVCAGVVARTGAKACAKAGGSDCTRADTSVAH